MSEELKARIAELEQKLCDSLDAERASYIRITELEAQQSALVEALRHYANGDCLSGHIARAAIAAVKPAGQEGSE